MKVVVGVVVLTLTRIVKHEVTGQAPVTLGWKSTSGNIQTKQNVIHAHNIADPIHASARKLQKMKSGVSLRRARSMLLHTLHYSRLKKLKNEYELPCCRLT